MAATSRDWRNVVLGKMSLGTFATVRAAMILRRLDVEPLLAGQIPDGGTTPTSRVRVLFGFDDVGMASNIALFDNKTFRAVALLPLFCSRVYLVFVRGIVALCTDCPR